MTAASRFISGFIPNASRSVVGAVSAAAPFLASLSGSSSFLISSFCIALYIFVAAAALEVMFPKLCFSRLRQCTTSAFN